ncbi:MAG: hypothetical protein PHH32_02130 [Eubacteriales bacterium]|nr:hypothetical protein [Eubacteriales bacterium]
MNADRKETTLADLLRPIDQGWIAADHFNLYSLYENVLSLLSESIKRMEGQDPDPDLEKIKKAQAALKETVDARSKLSAEALKKIQETSDNLDWILPYLLTLKEHRTDRDWYNSIPASAIDCTIRLYIADRGLESASYQAFEASRENFLAFFEAFITSYRQQIQQDPGREMIKTLGAVYDLLHEQGQLKDYKAAEITRTVYPLTLIAPIDKVSKKAFAGELTEQLQPLAMERRTSKKQVTTLASINFNAPQLQGLKGLTMYDRSVYNAVCTLYVRGGNEYITPQMIYQVMTGKDESYLNPKQAAAINSSITKFMYGGIYIDATEEVKKHSIGGSLIYDTNLLHAERVTHNLNGTITACIRIIKTPVLYEYASSKNQIGSAPIAALATPVNNTGDTQALKTYLLDRVFAMRGTDPQRDIAYSSIYSAVWGKQPSSTKGPQSGYSRLKKSRLRESAVKMLDYWTTEKGGALIKGFTEYKRGKTIAGVTISL